MNPCSAYCKPEEGLHTVLSWVTSMERAERLIGHVGNLHRRAIDAGCSYCFDPKASIQVVGYDTAAEVDPASAPWGTKFKIPVLLTVRILP